MRCDQKVARLIFLIEIKTYPQFNNLSEEPSWEENN